MKKGSRGSEGSKGSNGSRGSRASGCSRGCQPKVFKFSYKLPKNLKFKKLQKKVLKV